VTRRTVNVRARGEAETAPLPPGPDEEVAAFEAALALASEPLSTVEHDDDEG
jgi:hypothetical protein